MDCFFFSSIYYNPDIKNRELLIQLYVQFRGCDLNSATKIQHPKRNFLRNYLMQLDAGGDTTSVSL